MIEITVAVPVFVLGLFLGVAVGWFARGNWAHVHGVQGWAVLFPTLDAAARAWRTGGRVYEATQDGLRPLTQDEVSTALAVWLRDRGPTAKVHFTRKET